MDSQHNGTDILREFDCKTHWCCSLRLSQGWWAAPDNKKKKEAVLSGLGHVIEIAGYWGLARELRTGRDSCC